jgi:hypothetical protein
MVLGDMDTWGLLPLPAGQYRYVFSKSALGITGTWVTSEASLRRFIGNYASSSDCYIQLNPVSKPGLIRPSNADVLQLQAILIDIDPISDDALPDRGLLACQARLEELGVGHGCRTVIDSGRGIQVWLHIHPIPIIGEGSLGRSVRRFIHALAKSMGTVAGCRIDTSCADLSRLARLPGTINQKTGKPTKILDKGTPSEAYWLYRWDEEVAPKAPRVASPIRTKWPDIELHLTKTAKDFILEGVEEPGRHKAAVAAGRSLRENNVEPGVALGFLERGAERCSPPLDPSDVQRIFHQIWGQR